MIGFALLVLLASSSWAQTDTTTESSTAMMATTEAGTTTLAPTTSTDTTAAASANATSAPTTATPTTATPTTATPTTAPSPTTTTTLTNSTTVEATMSSTMTETENTTLPTTTPAVEETLSTLLIERDNKSGLKASYWLLVVVIVIALLFIVAAVYLLVYFQHEEDKGAAYVPKVILIIGMWLAMVNILMLPLDISNASVDGFFPMGTLWQVIVIWSVVWSVIVIPFAQLYYEAEDPLSPNKSQLVSALKIMCLGGLVALVIAFVAYLFFSVAQIPVQSIRSSMVDGFDLKAISTSSVEYTFISFRVSIVLFLISLYTFIGTCLLACFGGIGLAALPMDLVNEFRFRPTRISLEEYARQKLAMGDRATKLIAIGKTLQEEQRLKKSKSSSARQTMNRFKQNVYLLDEDWSRLHKAHTNRGARILWAYLQFAAGIGSAILSIIWALHICIFMLPRTPGRAEKSFLGYDLLGKFFHWFDEATSLPLAVLFYSLFAFYLLICIMKGNFKFGLRVFVIFPIHPMKIGATMVNSFLFNVGLIVIASVSTVQFCTSAFETYAVNSAAGELFGLAIQRLRYIEYFWYFYIVALLLFAVLGVVYLCVCPSDKSKVKDDDD